MQKLHQSRRNFLKKSAIGTAGVAFTAATFSAESYANIIGANDRVNVGIVGFSNRAQYSLIPAFMQYAKKMNFRLMAVSDIWNRRREECQAFMKEKKYGKVKPFLNNEALYDAGEVDAVIISTADFQHALHCKEAVEAGCDAYVEKPFAESMEDNRRALAACQKSGKVIQVGSQRRSGRNYHAAANFIQEGKFGDITMVEMTWNVNQPGRWRRPDLVASIQKSDVDWERYLMNRPMIPWDPRKYLEYRLFWPYSSGIPGQWMSHQIDTVHWFSGYDYPRSVAANGGIYMWDDGRENPDTMTAVFDYGPKDGGKGFQVVYSSRMHNSAGGVKEIYYSNGGTLNLKTGMVNSDGGLGEKHATAMNMQPNLLPEISLSELEQQAVTAANTGADNMTSAHMLNWMECVREQDPNTHAPAQVGYNHSVANIMTTAAMHTGKKVSFNEERQEVVVS